MWLTPSKLSSCSQTLKNPKSINKSKTGTSHGVKVIASCVGIKPRFQENSTSCSKMSIDSLDNGKNHKSNITFNRDRESRYWGAQVYEG